jgi:hypothetical protein
MATYSITHLHPLDESYYRMYLNEAMGEKFMTGMKTGFTDQIAKEDAAYAKYADAAKSALGKAQEFAGFIEKKTGLSPMLTVSLVAAGLTGGASSIPMAALMYFARRYYTKGLGKMVDIGVDTLADAGQKVFGGGKQQGQPQLQPEHFNFKSWLMTEEEKEGWGDWLAGKVGYGVGAVGGAFAALVKNVYNTVASRMKELASFIAQNPRQAAKIALTIGLAAATGGVVGKLSKDVVNAVGAKIQSLLPQGSDLAQVQQAIVPEAGAGDFEGGSASGGDLASAASAKADAATATADQMKHGGSTLINKDMDSFRAQMRAPQPPSSPDDLLKDLERYSAEDQTRYAAMSPHEKLQYKFAQVQAAKGDQVDPDAIKKLINHFANPDSESNFKSTQRPPEIDAIIKDAERGINAGKSGLSSDEISKLVNQFADKTPDAPAVPDKWERLKRFTDPKPPDTSGVWSNPDPEVDKYLKQAQQGIADKAAKTAASMKAAERFANRN